ncbi:MAG: hypothetical protein JWO80_5970 [Bryobacterales bacterium]|nr:hypothetical protein [Bryobacterales bacterium]
MAIIRPCESFDFFPSCGRHERVAPDPSFVRVARDSAGATQTLRMHLCRCWCEGDFATVIAWTAWPRSPLTRAVRLFMSTPWSDRNYSTARRNVGKCCATDRGKLENKEAEAVLRGDGYGDVDCFGVGAFVQNVRHSRPRRSRSGGADPTTAQYISRESGHGWFEIGVGTLFEHRCEPPPTASVLTVQSRIAREPSCGRFRGESSGGSRLVRQVRRYRCRSHRGSASPKRREGLRRSLRRNLRCRRAN